MQSTLHSKGKIERFHRTLRDQFLRRLDDPGQLTLAELNRRLGIWLEGEYHLEPHSGLGGGRTPLDAWALTAAGVRPAGPPERLDELCRLRYGRKVSRDRVVQFRSRCYEVSAELTGRKVELLVDPAAPPERPIPVECDGRPAGLATPLDRVANSRARRRPARKRKARKSQAGQRPAGSAATAGDPEPTRSGLRMSDLEPGPEEESS